MKERLEQLLQQPIRNIQKLHGDASYRAYYRIEGSKRTWILMALPVGKLSASEEITNLKNRPTEMPFINVHRFLEQVGLPVPKIELFSETDRWLLLEDLGDVTLYQKIAGKDATTQFQWYQKAFDLLIQLKHQTLHPSPSQQKECIVFQRSFDATLFNWEFDHFWEYGLLARGIEPTTAEHSLFLQQTRELTQQLLQLPQGFTHRDYQSRNLMVHQERLYLIDFQDALIGPIVYDVVSLLRDSYVDLPATVLQQLLHYYCQKTGKEATTFRKQFDLQTVQRKLKDAGRFVYIDRVKKNPNFLPYIPVSLGYVREALSHLPEFEPLFKLLQKHLPEWR